MTDNQEKLIESKIKEQLDKTRIQGIGIGAKSVSSVVYDKIKHINSQSSKNDLLRAIKDIRQFCETGLAINKDKIDKKQ